MNYLRTNYLRLLRLFKSLKTLFLKRKVLSLAALAVLLIGGYLVFAGGNDEPQVYAASLGEFVQEVSASGTVTPASDVSMSFAHTGRVARINVKVGDTVRRGQALVSLEIGTLAADLASAQAEASLKRIAIENESVNVEEVRRQQDALVESAYRDLLSEGLIAVPSAGSADVSAPTITGAYTGGEGTYRINIERKPGGFIDYQIRTFGLETTGPIDILDNEPTPLGRKGLYLTFPEDASAYSDTRWEVTIPNTTSSSYLANYNAYQEALRERSKSIAEAEAQLRRQEEGLTAAEAELRRAQADVMRIQTEIAERTLRAPFDGTVTVLDTELGATVSIDDPVVSVISENDLEIESYVPEINISHLSVGDPALVTLDAYGETVPFEARVIAIDPAETVRDGVSTYRVRLQFSEEDDRIRSGMTANIVITTDRRSDVLTVPQGAITIRNGKRFAKILVDGETEDREVVTGAVSSLGQVEILSGIAPGESVIVD